MVIITEAEARQQMSNRVLKQEARFRDHGFPLVESIYSDQTILNKRELYEQGPAPDLLLGRLNKLIAETGNPFLSAQQIKALDAGIPQEEISFTLDNFREGQIKAIRMAQELIKGKRYDWWDIDSYRVYMEILKKSISPGQFVSVLGDYALNRSGNLGPLMVVNDFGVFPQGEEPLFIDALTNATVTNFGGYPDQVVMAHGLNRLEMGAQCPPYTPTTMMDTTSNKLLKLSPIDSEGADVAFFNAGGDSVAVAMKAAEKYVDSKKGHNGHVRKTVFFKEAYHGNIESGAGHATSGIRESFHESVRSSIELEYPNEAHEIEPVLNQIRQEVKEDQVSSVVFEPTQGDGGGVTMQPKFFNELVKLSIDESIPLICDEVQSGFGRSGKYFDVEYLLESWREYRSQQDDGFQLKYPEKPPMMIAIAKSITNGAVPGSAVLLPKEYAVLARAEGLNTFSAHPATLAAIIATTEMMTPELLEIVKEKRALFDKEIAPYVDGQWIKEVRGHGMHLFLPILGTGLVEKDGKAVSNNQVVQSELLGHHRILTGTVARDGLRVHLPLNAPDEVIVAVARSIGEVVDNLKKGIVSEETRKILSSSVSGLASRGD